MRAAHIALFVLASRDDPDLRSSVAALAVSTALGVGLLVGASFLDGLAQGALWVLALALDMGGPFFFGSGGWKLVPGHFAERYGLIIIIALGESIVAIGVGAHAHLDWGIAAAAVSGSPCPPRSGGCTSTSSPSCPERRLIEAPEGRVRNELARDSYSYIHFPMVAGIVLMALGLKTTLAHVSDPLHTVPAFALLGGISVYLLGLVAFRYRHVHTINRQRLGMAVLLLALLPLATNIPAIATLSIVVALLAAMITYETRSYGEGRFRTRHQDFAPEGPAT